MKSSLFQLFYRVVGPHGRYLTFKVVAFAAVLSCCLEIGGGGGGRCRLFYGVFGPTGSLLQLFYRDYGPPREVRVF